MNVKTTPSEYLDESVWTDLALIDTRPHLYREIGVEGGG